jgi:hypothetical protein
MQQARNEIAEADFMCSASDCHAHSCDTGADLLCMLTRVARCVMLCMHRLRAHEGVLTAVLRVQEALLTVPATTTVPSTVLTTAGTAVTSTAAAAAGGSAKRLSGASEHGNKSDNEQDDITATVNAKDSDSEADDDDADASSNAKKGKGKGGKSKKLSKAAKQVSFIITFHSIMLQWYACYSAA